MKTAYLIAISALALMLAMCAGCDDGESDSRGFCVVAQSFRVEHSQQVPGYYLFGGTVRLYDDSEWPGLVQEVRINGELVCVEYFTVRGTYAIDWHTGGLGEHREMTVYRADVSGCALDAHGFGVIWQVDDRINQGYVASGAITRRDARTIHWSIEALPDGVRVTIDGKTKPARRG